MRIFAFFIFIQGIKNPIYMKTPLLYLLVFLSIAALSCANSEKSAGTPAEMEASVKQLADDMCLAKNAVAQNGDDPEKLAEYEQRAKEFDKRLAELESQYSSEEKKMRIQELLANMTSNCVKK
jgi:hypothetical protein